MTEEFCNIAKKFEQPGLYCHGQVKNFYRKYDKKRSEKRSEMSDKMAVGLCRNQY